MIKNLLHRFKFLLLAVFAVVVATVIETNNFSTTISDSEFQRFQKEVSQKISAADDFCAEIAAFPDSTGFYTYDRFRRSHKSEFGSQNLSFFVFKNHEMFYWSSNSVSADYETLADASGLFFSGNTWYLVSHSQNGGTDVFVLTFLKSQYSFENKYITNKFHDDFHIKNTAMVYSDSCDDTHPIYDNEGKFLFSLSTAVEKDESKTQCYICILLYLASIVLVLLFLDRNIQRIQNPRVQNLVNLGAIAVMVLFRWYMTSEQIPYIGYTTALFDKSVVSLPLSPSLGDTIINSFLLFYVVIQVARIFSQWKCTGKRFGTMAFLVSSLFFWCMCSQIFTALASASQTNLKLFNILNVNAISFVVYGEMALLLYLQYILFAAFFTNKKTEGRQAVQEFIACFAAAAVVLILLRLQWFFIAYYLGVSLIFFIFWHFCISNNSILKIGILLISALFVEIFVARTVNEKDVTLLKQRAIELATEQDPVAESFLTQVYKDTRADKTLADMVRQPEIEAVEIRNYLQKRYFSGFLSQYELECTVCGTDTSFGASNLLANCERFFNQMLLASGESVSDSNYYYVNSQDGNITYFDSIQYNYASGGATKLYIELHSTNNIQNFGYPAILLNGEVPATDTDISSAKYKNGVLISKRGRTPYSQKLQLFENRQLDTKETAGENFHLFVDNQHSVRHLAYKINEQFTVVVSERMMKWSNYIMWFPYIFLYFLVLAFAFNLSHDKEEIRITYSLSNQIKKSLIGLLLGFFVLIGVFGAFFMKMRNEQQQRSVLDEKTMSVANALAVEYKDDATIADKDELQRILSNLSEIYMMDINFYNPEGRLLASSRPEIFQYKLQDEKMAPSAYDFLVNRSYPRYMLEERMGDLPFLSAFSVLANSQNQILGYVNLPNFSTQRDFQQQFAGMIVSMVNLVVILLLLVAIVSVLIAKEITSPLVVLQNKMRQVSVGSDNEKIEIAAPDELSGLLQNYNQMIDQLSVSADKLAKAERESAWREMARQIAHEIKNPLTPMKLSIQLLNRSWDEKDERFGTRLKSISKTMIEQIDTLADTATSFSDFAKLSNVTLEAVDINELLQNCATLFGQEENISIELKLPPQEMIVVADKEKSVRLFNNLLKNAVQAIPNSRQGHIAIETSIDDNFVTIAIADNGQGISDEVKHHLFELHFTTKSTGSGFGLAMCKSIVEACNGEIWFETEEGKGTTFFVKLPRGKGGKGEMGCCL